MNVSSNWSEPALAPDDLWERKQTPAMLAFLSAAYAVVFTLSIVGNAVVIATVYRIPSMHTTINYFICNLSTADILVAIFCLPLNLISSTFSNWVFGKTLCKAVTYLQGVAVAASVTTLSIIAFDRYLAVCRPLMRHFSKKLSVVFLVAIWTYCLLILLPWALYFDLKTVRISNRTNLMCDNQMPYKNEYQMGVIFCLLYAAPLIFIAVCYGLVAQKLSRRTTQQEEFLRKSSTVQESKQMNRLVIMLVTVVLIFALSWLPLHLVTMLFNLKFFKPYFKAFLGPATLSLLQWIGISNCCVNPWIYCAFSKNYRTNFINTLRCNFVNPSQGCGAPRRHAHNHTASAANFHRTQIDEQCSSLAQSLERRRLVAGTGSMALVQVNQPCEGRGCDSKSIGCSKEGMASTYL